MQPIAGDPAGRNSLSLESQMAATVVSPRSPAAPGAVSLTRLRSIDLVRGVIMVLMAIDHVRVYAGVPAGGPTAGLFFTRWVTHFCAPGFAFLAGASAFYYGRKAGGWRPLSRYLLTRGLLLVALELTVIHVAWTFAFDFTQLLAGVIWMLGWCMVVMAALVRFPPRRVGMFGVAIIAAQQLFRLPPQIFPASTGWLWQVLYLGGPVTVPPVTIAILYNIVPWLGVMAAGYGFGEILARGEADRRRLCLRIGLSATALFLLVGGLVVFAAPMDEEMPRLFQLLNQNKYRDSQLFLLMTLGPPIALLPVAERARGWGADALVTFGRAPFFYYLLHIPLIHALALVVWRLRDGHVDPDLFGAAPLFVAVPDGQQWALPLLYLVFAVVVVILYFCCRWYVKVRAAQPRTWLRYI